MTCADKIAEALAALEELANMPLGISLADWSRLSSPILESLREQAPADLADAQAQEIARLKAIIARMDGAVPVADKTCDQPGITLSEAVMRQWPELRVGSGR